MQAIGASPAFLRFCAARADWLTNRKVGRFDALVVTRAAYCCLQVAAMTLLRLVKTTGSEIPAAN